MATNNNKFLVKNGLAVGSSIDVINSDGQWIGATGSLHGATGPQGEQGASGIQGIDGASGYVGSDGATGPAGTDGATGPQGASGISGASGVLDPVVTTLEVTDTLEISRNSRDGVVALSIPDGAGVDGATGGVWGVGQLIFEGNHPTYGIIPSNDDRYSLGNPSFAWSTLYTHAINFSDSTTLTTAPVDGATGPLQYITYGDIDMGTILQPANISIDLGTFGGASGASGATGFDFSGDLMSLTGTEDLLTGSGTEDLNA